MKKLSTLLIVTLISGCSWFTPPSYDTNEYLFFVEMDVHSKYLVSECKDPVQAKNRIDILLFKGDMMENFTKFLPNTEELSKISVIINKQLNALNAKYEDGKHPSKAYCILKAKLIDKELQRVLRSVGNLQ
jgi:hypothetical protein